MGDFDPKICARMLHNISCDVFLVRPCNASCMPLNLVGPNDVCARIEDACPGMMAEVRDLRPGTFQHVVNLLTDIPDNLITDVFEMLRSGCEKPTKYFERAISDNSTMLNACTIAAHRAYEDRIKEYDILAVDEGDIVKDWFSQWKVKRGIAWVCFNFVNVGVFFLALAYIGRHYARPGAVVKPLQSVVLPYSDLMWWGIAAVIFLYVLFAGVFGFGTQISKKSVVR